MRSLERMSSLAGNRLFMGSCIGTGLMTLMFGLGRAFEDARGVDYDVMCR